MLIIAAIIVICFLAAKQFFFDIKEGDPELYAAAWRSLTIGTLIAIGAVLVEYRNRIKGQKAKENCMPQAVIACLIGCIVSVFIWDFRGLVTGELEFSFINVFLMLISPIVYGIVFIIPSVIVGLVIGGIAELLWKIGQKKK